MSEAGTAVAAATTVTPFSADPYFATMPDEFKGFFKNKGWDTKTPAEAAFEAAKSYSEAEKHIGIPKDQLLRVPKDANDAEGWKAVHTRLGAPDKPEGYDFSAVKKANGEAPDEQFLGAVRASLFAKGVPASAAIDIVKDLVKFQDGTSTDAEATRVAALTAQREAWVKSCGPNLAANEFIANQAAEKLGWGKDILLTLSSVVGADKVMAGLLDVGKKMGEDKFVSNQNTNAPGVLTREQATARLAELKNDTVWVGKFNAGDTKANEEFNALVKIQTAG